MAKFDPNGVFMNNFGRRLKGIGNKMDIDPLTKRCALLDNCFCTKDSDCGRSQICTTLPNYSFNVCKTINEFPETFDHSKIPPLDKIIEYFEQVPTLAAQVAATCPAETIFEEFVTAIQSIV